MDDVYISSCAIPKLAFLFVRLSGQNLSNQILRAVGRRELPTLASLTCSRIWWEIFPRTAASGTLSKAMQMECEKFASCSVLSCDSHWKWIKQRPWAGKPEFWFWTVALKTFQRSASTAACLSVTHVLNSATCLATFLAATLRMQDVLLRAIALQVLSLTRLSPPSPWPILKAEWLYESFEFLPLLASSNCELHHFARARLQLRLQDTMQVSWRHLCTSDSGFKLALCNRNMQLRTVGSAMFGTLLRSTRNSIWHGHCDFPWVVLKCAKKVFHLTRSQGIACAT